jgi:catechol 2,3-dioxygenase-like lactoylglutathione lyase family enzyme
MKVAVITLGVADIATAAAFYRDGLGLPVRDDKPPLLLCDLGGIWLSLFPRDALARYANVPSEGKGFSGITMACRVDSEEEVDRLLSKARTAGASILRPPRANAWGAYTGCFSDPDGHLWEVVYNARPFVANKQGWLRALPSRLLARARGA